MPEDAPRRPSLPWAPLLSALLLALAFAGAWPLVFVALVPWLLSLRGTTPRQAWNRGYAFGLLFSLTQLWWLGDLASKWTHSPILGVVPWLAASLLSAVYYGLLGRLVRSCEGVPWAVPLVWAGMEVLRSYIPVFAFPWALLGEPLMAVPELCAGAWLGTVFLVSAMVVGANRLVLLALTRALPLPTKAMALVMIPLVFLMVSAIGRPGGKPLATVAAGQIGVDMAFDEDAPQKIGPAVEALAAEAKDADLLVLSEGIAQGGATIPPKTPFRLPPRPSVVFGGQRGEGTVYQSAFALEEGRWTYADKTRLVIFGEFVPGRDYFPFLQSAFHLPGGDLSAGDKLATVRAGGHTVGPLICFEGLFPDLGLRQARAGADVLAVMSIDDWFALPARARLAQAAQWRAVESGLPLVRAGSLGRTMIVSPTGRVLADAPLGDRRLVVATVPKGRGPFPLVWVFPAVSLLSIIAVPLWHRGKRLPSLASPDDAPPSPEGP